MLQYTVVVEYIEDQVGLKLVLSQFCVYDCHSLNTIHKKVVI